MEKLGLCVCYDTKNFGSQLQVMATEKIVRLLGYDSEIIRYKKRISLQFIAHTIPRFFNPSFLKTKFGGRSERKKMKKYPEIINNVKIRNMRFEQFVDSQFECLSKIYYGYEQLVAGTNNYDAFLVGSDQLWLPSNMGSRFYNLLFVPEQYPKVAYATSFGVGSIPWFQKRRTANYLKRFNHLSTREQQGAKIINDLIQKEVPVVCDPTLLFDAKEWTDFIPTRSCMDEPYMFCYFLGKNTEHREIAEELQKDTGLPIVTIPFLDDFVESDLNFGDKSLYDVDAADFVNLIRNAEYILTDSFHGSVFSILNHKQFIVLDRFSNSSANSRNSRIDSLCSMLNLEERRYQSDILEQIQRPIDYVRVDQKLEELRLQSKQYLEEALNDVCMKE